MRGFPSLNRSNRHPRQMLIVGLFAMLLHLLAGSGLVRADNAGPQGFVPELCSSHGLVKPGTAGDLPQASHDCCKLCAAGAPPMLAMAAVAVASPPHHVCLLGQPQFAAPGSAHASAHRPRGPPRAA